MEPAPLEARGLTKSFKDFKAVDGIDLQIAPGECLALLGPNGAGKTTTVEMLEGLSDPTSGEISIFGMGYSKKRRAIQQQIGVLLQETYLYKRFTARETLTMFASFFPNPRPVDEVLELLQINDKADTRLMNLSGGQKQRVYIGCSLINSPKLLFLDEPTTGLDPQARRMIWELISNIKANGTAILLTTHYMEEAEKLADRIAIIDKGQIIASGSPDELIEAHADNEVKTIRRGNMEDVFIKLTGRSIRDG